MRSPSFDENPERSLPTYGRSSSRKRDSASFGRVLSYFQTYVGQGLVGPARLRHAPATILRGGHRPRGGQRGVEKGALALRSRVRTSSYRLVRRARLPRALLRVLHGVHVALHPSERPHRGCVQVNRHLGERLHRHDRDVRRPDRRAAVRDEQGQMPGPGRVSIRGGYGVAHMPADGGLRRGPGSGGQEPGEHDQPRGGERRSFREEEELLQFEGLIDFVADNGADSFPKDAVDVDDALSEAASPCAGCKKLATQVFKEAENGAPDKRWVEAMIRVHGKEWCIRQSASVLPAYDPWKTYRGITSWAQVGNTPADENYMKANGIPKFGGAGAMKSKNTDKNTTWPPQDAVRSGEYNPFVANATGNRNGTFDNSTFVDPPVNEALMKLLLENSPQLACPLSKADKVRKVEALLRGETWPPPVRPPPPWAKHCVKNATRDVIGHVGHTSIHSRASLEFAILVPAMIMFSVMIINSAAMLYWVETPIVFGGIVVLALVLADNWLAVRNMIHCMDRVFLALNILHMSIIAGAMLSAVGLLGHRTLMGGTLWDAERTRWREWMAPARC